MIAEVIANHELCREHLRLALRLPLLEHARPGQFLHLGRPVVEGETQGGPFLRRAFSIAGLRRLGRQCEVDIIYRIHGAGTQWMATLRAGDEVSALGPLGSGFKFPPDKRSAWLVAGGVGLPPILWLAEWLHRTGTDAVVFYGTRTRELTPLEISAPDEVPADGRSVSFAAPAFARYHTPVVLSTDDGSLGFRGSVGEALSVYHRAWGGDEREVAVYCCGPEVMMAAVARWCEAHGITCYVCMEREMACGTGTCQSCVVPVRDAVDPEGWRYALCCSEGPVFDARQVIWS